MPGKSNSDGAAEVGGALVGVAAELVLAEAGLEVGGAMGAAMGGPLGAAAGAAAGFIAGKIIGHLASG